MSGLPLVHVDDALVVLDKPSGELAVPGRGADKQACLLTRAQLGFPELLVVHRLDMATSGLIVFARGAAAQRALSMAFERRAVHKTYEAVVHGLVAEDEGSIELPLAADWERRPMQRVDQQRGKPSLTHWRVLHRDAARQRSRLSLTPVTGRSHQLRVHLRELGHPILGDTLYAPAAVADAEPRLLLHARALRLSHPVNGNELLLQCPVPF